MKKILIVEDDITLQKSLREELEDEGFEVFIASDGEEGVTLALADPPDLVLMDILMPKKDGLIALSDMKAHSKLKNIPVILLTNVSDTDKLAEGLEKGAYTYLVKSQWKLGEVAQKVKDKLGV